jgi:spermidine synthase
VDTDEGPLELRRRGDSDYMITIDGRSLMISHGNRSEIELAEMACTAHKSPKRVLVGGLGMGFTLRAALDSVGPDAEVTVAELTPTVVDWCKGEMAHITDDACGDPRTRIVVGDVAEVIARGQGSWDVIILDLYEGPHAATQRQDDPFYGSRALKRTAEALRKGGVFAVWSEEPDQGFESRLTKAGFQWQRHKRGRGRTHTIYLATR